MSTATTTALDRDTHEVEVRALGGEVGFVLVRCTDKQSIGYGRYLALDVVVNHDPLRDPLDFGAELCRRFAAGQGQDLDEIEADLLALSGR